YSAFTCGDDVPGDVSRSLLPLAMAATTSAATTRPRGPEPIKSDRSTPFSPASLRAIGVTETPPAVFAAANIRDGVRTSKKGSSASVGTATLLEAAGTTTLSPGRGPYPAKAASIAISPLAAMTATTAPTGAVAPACTRISARVPAVIDGTSIDTLSVSTSNRLSPGSTASPADLNHFVIVPSATVSPSCGIKMSIPRF